MSRSILVRALRVVGVTVVGGVLMVLPPGPASAAPVLVGGDGPVRADPVTYEFAVPVPDGGRLVALPDEPDPDRLAGAILVQDASGAVVGAYDEAFALDADGAVLATSYRIEGSTLVQTVRVTPATALPVVVHPPSFSAIGQTTVDPGIAFVSVPSHYVYNPALGALHDYCTASPDEFPNPFGSNADFRGPCARHDLCYAGSTSEFTCDNRLWSDMMENCSHEYGWQNPVRYACYDTADIYWAAVVIA